MLTKRILSSFLLIIFIIAAVIFEWVFAAVAIFFTVLGLHEFFTMLKKKDINVYTYVGVGIGTIIPISILFNFALTRTWELLFIVLTLFVLILMQFTRRQNSGVIVGISTTIFGILYVSWFFSFVIKIRFLPQGVGLLATLLLVTKLGDIGAYLFGVRFGKTPLLPRVSPHKSVEGSIGGLIFSVLGALVAKSFVDFSYVHLVFIGLFLGLFGQLGDLSESLMKRDCHVKDSGSLIPGMGGILDTIDSILFTAPVFYFYLSLMIESSIKIFNK